MSSRSFAGSHGADHVAEQKKRAALRIAFGVTASFSVVEAFEWNASFLAPLLAAMLLVKLERPPSLVQGLVLIVVIVLSAGAALIATKAALSNPLVLIMALTLLIYLAFYAHRRGAPEFATLFPQISAVSIPVVAVLSPPLADEMASALTSAGIVALLTVWASHAAFPAPASESTAWVGTEPPEPLPAAQSPSAAARHALLDTLVLFPGLAWFVLDASEVAVVALIITITLLRAHHDNSGLRIAAGVLVANLLGGLSAAVVYGLVTLVDTLAFFTAVCLAACLLFAGRIVTAGDLAQVYALALVTFLILVGLGVAPLPGSSGEFFVQRFLNVLLASAYTIGALSLMAPWRPPRAASV
jgi:hypothetical protein